MSLEIGSVESDEFDIYYGAGFSRDQNSGLSDIEHRTQKVAQMNPMGAGGNIKSYILPMKGTVGGSVEAKANTDGKGSLDFEVYAKEKDDDGNSVSVSAGSSVQRDDKGDVQASGSIKVSVERDF